MLLKMARLSAFVTKTILMSSSFRIVSFWMFWFLSFRTDLWSYKFRNVSNYRITGSVLRVFQLRGYSLYPETLSFGFVMDVESIFVGSLVIPSAEVIVGCASVLFDEWVGSFGIVVGISVVFVCCCMTTGWASSDSGVEKWWKESTLLRVMSKCLKSSNFGILNCGSMTNISCRKECLLERNVVQIKDDFEVVL